MSTGTITLFAATVLTGISVAALTAVGDAAAQQPGQLTEQEKLAREKHQKAQQQQQQQQQQPNAGAPKQPSAPPKAVATPPAVRAVRPQMQPTVPANTQPTTPAFKQPSVSPTTAQPALPKVVPASPTQAGTAGGVPKPTFNQLPQRQQPVDARPQSPAAAKVVNPAATQPAAQPAAAINNASKTVTAAPGPVRFDQVKQERVVSTDRGGRQIIKEPGNRTIIRQDNRIIVHHDETVAVQNFHPGAQVSKRAGGITETVYVRPDGVRVVSEVDESGRLLRRYGAGAGGREIVYIDNRKFYRNVAIGAGIAAIGVGVALALAPPTVSIPRERYIVDYERASDDDIYYALSAPPVMQLERDYSLEEIRYNRLLRDRMPRLDLDTVTFDTGSFTVSPEQYDKLARVARAMRRGIERNPAEMFLIEGHTDAVGSPEDNLSLSDRRAEAIARVLVEYFDIPSENLITQGYGEQYLKIETQAAERVNRRVAVRRISPLLGQG